MSILFFTFRAKLVNAEPMTIIIPDDYLTIQEGINAASDGDTIFVRSGNHHGIKNPSETMIVVNKSISLIGENKSNTVLDGEYWFVTIIHIEADNVTVKGFTIQNAASVWCLCGGGIVLGQSKGSRIVDNIIRTGRHHSAAGIRLWSANNTLIADNIFIDNGNAIYCKPYPYEANNNIIYHNNFVESSWHAAISPLSSNIWDDGYPSGGNYWDDYNGTDLYSGIFQNETGSDGIGDTCYVINENNTDRYPLTRPWNWPLLGETNFDFKIDIKDIAVAAKAFGSYPEHPEWNPLADITGPEHLVPDGKVDIRDLALIASNFGKTYP